MKEQQEFTIHERYGGGRFNFVGHLVGVSDRENGFPAAYWRDFSASGVGWPVFEDIGTVPYFPADERAGLNAAGNQFFGQIQGRGFADVSVIDHDPDFIIALTYGVGLRVLKSKVVGRDIGSLIACRGLLSRPEQTGGEKI